jgi:hypothetical protein
MANNRIPNVPSLSGKLAVVTGSNNAGVMTPHTDLDGRGAQFGLRTHG